MDVDPGKTAEEKITAACKLYKRRFGRAATAVYVHPSVVVGDMSVKVVPKTWCLRHHFFALEEE